MAEDFFTEFAMGFWAGWPRLAEGAQGGAAALRTKDGGAFAPAPRQGFTMLVPRLRPSKRESKGRSPQAVEKARRQASFSDEDWSFG